VIGCAQDRSMMIAKVRNIVHAGKIVHILFNETGIGKSTQTSITSQRLGE
jgi:hypothetical protein